MNIFCRHVFVLLGFSRWFVLGLLFSLSSTADGGIIMEAMVLPPVEDAVWEMAAAGETRYAGGWLPLDRPLTVVADSDRTWEPPAPLPLRIGTSALGSLMLTDAVWDDAGVGGLSTVDRLLLGWALRVPVYPQGPVRLTLTERMLLVPRQLRITLEPLAPEDE